MDTYGVEPLSADATNMDKFKIAGYLNFYLWFAIVFCTLTVLILKETIRRERPKRHEIPFTVFDVAKSENNTFAMPSGDSAAAAVWGVLIGYSL